MLFALAILAAAGPGEVGAQAYPSKPVRIIVPNATSGLADICARLLATNLGEALGQTFLVDNRPGAGGTLGTAGAARSAPGSPADLHRWIRAEMERWGRVIREQKITLE